MTGYECSVCNGYVPEIMGSATGINVCGSCYYEIHAKFELAE